MTRTSVLSRLREANPVANESSFVPDSHAQQALEYILAQPRNPVSPAPAPTAARQGQRSARRLQWTAAVAASGVAGLFALTFTGGPVAHADPATPQLLAYGHGGHADAQAALLAAAHQLGATGHGNGPVLHTHFQTWALNIDASSGDTSTFLVTSNREYWFAADGASRVRQGAQSASILAGQAFRHEVTNADSRDYGPGGYANSNAGLPNNADDLKQAIRPRTTSMSGTPDVVIGGYLTGNLAEGSASPEQTAAIYQVLASLPGTFDAGDLADRAGRAGHAIGIVTSDPSSPTINTEYVIFSPTDGTLLEIDAVYSPDPPRGLHLRPGPMVASYTLMMENNRVANLGTS